MKITEKKFMKLFNEHKKYVFGVLRNDETTYNTELDKVGVYLFGDKYMGTFPIDMMPELKNNKYMIVNLDNSFQSGSHWVALIKKNNKIYHYDSFGRTQKKIIPTMKNKGGAKVINSKPNKEQDVKETNCGLLCLTVLLLFENYGKGIFNFI